MSGRPSWKLLLTCEHAGFEIPAEFASSFADAGDVLRSHRGWDPGALDVAAYLSRSLAAPLIATRVSRLLVETNRSRSHPKLFSEFVKALPVAKRDSILQQYYFPHRQSVVEWIKPHVQARKTVLHVAVHSFTPVLNGEVRLCDVGLLYDPQRTGERKFCRGWKQAMLANSPGWRVRMNYPYRGAADGLTTCLRKMFPRQSYLGIELELNQLLVVEPAKIKTVRKLLAATLRMSLDDLT
ncbi:MAG TPA: N-formylglutamate amidohydrolase [Pirellulaceae bacterium]|nr:N-formylglutamate amidohydrolase [Pirellulaceae bacterium]